MRGTELTVALFTESYEIAVAIAAWLATSGEGGIPTREVEEVLPCRDCEVERACRQPAPSSSTSALDSEKEERWNIPKPLLPM